MAVDTAQVLEGLREFDATPDDAGQRGSEPWCYWRKADGWITIGPNWSAAARERERRRGMECLDQYGEFFMSNSDTPVRRNGRQVGTMRGWNPNRDKYRLIIAAGGAHEFPPDQIVQLGWHLKPPGQGVNFPQLDGYEIREIECPSCHKQFHDLRQGERVLIDGTANLQRHETTMHATVASQNSQARLTAEAMAQLSGPMGEILKALVEQQSKQGEILAALLAERRDERSK